MPTKKPSAKQLAARAKFVKMVRAKAAKSKAAKNKTVGKIVKKKTVKKAAKKKVIKQTGTSNKVYDKRKQANKPGKRISKKGNVYYENRENRSDKGRLLGIYDDFRLLRVNNDINGNPRYVVHFLNILNNEENSFLPFNKKYEYSLKKAKIIGGKKYDNKQYGGGIVFQSYNSDDLKRKIVKVMQTTPKIKY